jgi:hypothetical protein
MDITLLGPQRRVAGARAAVAELIPDGPVATINAGWRERETDTDELDAVLGGSAGAMALSSRVMLFGDHGPFAHQDAEFYAAGLGLYAQGVPSRTLGAGCG